MVFADGTAPDDLSACLVAHVRGVPDGVSAMTAADACAHGIRSCAAAFRI